MLNYLAQLGLFRNHVSDLVKIDRELPFLRHLLLRFYMRLDHVLFALLLRVNLFTVLPPQSSNQLLLLSIEPLVDAHVGILLHLKNVLHNLAHLSSLGNFFFLELHLPQTLGPLGFKDLCDVFFLLSEKSFVL